MGQRIRLGDDDSTRPLRQTLLEATASSAVADAAELGTPFQAASESCVSLYRPHQKHFCGRPSCFPDSLLNQGYLFDASEWQGLGHILTLAARETQKVAFDLYFEEVEFIRSKIPHKSQKGV